MILLILTNFCIKIYHLVRCIRLYVKTTENELTFSAKMLSYIQTRYIQ